MVIDYNKDEREEDFVGQVNNATDLIGHDCSALSLDGKSLIVPDYGDVDDMSSLGTSKCTYRGDGGSAVGYIGDLRIVGRADDYKTDPSTITSLEKKLSSRYEEDPELQYGDYDVKTYCDSLPIAKGEDLDLSQSFAEKKYEEEEEAKKFDCIPQWITDAPLWLKLVIICSIALLLGALILIAVGAQLSTEKQISPSFQEKNPTSNPVNFPIRTDAPAGSTLESGPVNSTAYPDQLAITVTSSSTLPPSLAPVDSILPPMVTISNSEYEVPTSAPSYTPTTSSPTQSPTNSPTQSPTLSTVNFFVMGGRFDGEDTKTLENGLKSLPITDGNTILIHLGDWNSPYSTSCVEDSFITNVDSYQKSSVPVYFVPGDNEYNDCPDPTEALGFWNQYLLDFETKYWQDPSWDVLRQSPDYSENFAFLQRQVLFVGINLVGGIVHDQEEWDARHQADLLWIDTTAAKFDGNFTTMVVLAHADPEIEINHEFFKDFYLMVERYDEKVIFVHRNLGIDTWKKESGFNDIPNLEVVAVEGSKWPPMWVQIDPIIGTYTIDQSTWHDEYVATGALPTTP